MSRLRSGHWPLGWRWTAVLLALAAVFVGLRGVHALTEPPTASAIFTSRVVVVGVTDHFALTPADEAVLADHLEDAQVASMAVRPRYVGTCAAAGWLTLGAGRRTTVPDAGCTPQVTPVGNGGSVADWIGYVTGAAKDNGDARLGTLADSVPGCVEAVGPGAALAAARADGTVARYRTPDAVAADPSLSCPVTLVDAGAQSDALIATWAKDPDVTVIVTGIGPGTGATAEPGRGDPGLQVIYRLGTTIPGWLTSASTRRSGIVTLTDLTRTLVDFGRTAGGAAAATHLPIDGSPFAVYPDVVTIDGFRQHLQAVTNLSDGAPRGYIGLGAVGGVLLLLIVGGILTRRLLAPRIILVFATVLSTAMMLTGSVPWQDSARPGTALTLAVFAWGTGLTAVAFGLARRLAVPPEIVAASIAVAALTADAALGGVLQAGSMLNSRPVFSLRWYGFGNVTFAVYAAAGLTLAGYVGHRFLAQGRRVAALVAVAAIGFGVVLCEGWPSMGTDFGGVIALTPPVLWLLLTLAGVRLTWPRLLAVGGSAVVAIAAISFLDWLRGPDARSHLGNFVQRVIDGDAVDVVFRKAIASGETIVSVLGIVSILLGVLGWIVMFRRIIPQLSDDFTTLRPLAWAVLATAVLGMLLNDGGISVWITLTGCFALTVVSLWVGRESTAGRRR